MEEEGRRVWSWAESRSQAPDYVLGSIAIDASSICTTLGSTTRAGPWAIMMAFIIDMGAGSCDSIVLVCSMPHSALVFDIFDGGSTRRSMVQISTRSDCELTGTTVRSRDPSLDQ